MKVLNILAGTQQLSVCCCLLKIKKSENFKKDLITDEDQGEKGHWIKDL